MVWEWFGGGWGVVGSGLGLVWGWFGGVVGGQCDGEIRVTIRAGLLSHWPPGGAAGAVLGMSLLSFSVVAARPPKNISLLNFDLLGVRVRGRGCVGVEG